MTERNGDSKRCGGSPRFYELLDEMGNVHAAKNSDYSPGADPFANFREAEAIGVPAWIGAYIRMTDKSQRLQGLVRQFVMTGTVTPAVIDERLEDTLLDLANYAVIVRCLYEEAVAAVRISAVTETACNA